MNDQYQGAPLCMLRRVAGACSLQPPQPLLCPDMHACIHLFASGSAVGSRGCWQPCHGLQISCYPDKVFILSQCMHFQRGGAKQRAGRYLQPQTVCMHLTATRCLRLGCVLLVAMLRRLPRRSAIHGSGLSRFTLMHVCFPHVTGAFAVPGEVLAERKRKAAERAERSQHRSRRRLRQSTAHQASVHAALARLPPPGGAAIASAFQPINAATVRPPPRISTHAFPPSTLWSAGACSIRCCCELARATATGVQAVTDYCRGGPRTSWRRG